MVLMSESTWETWAEYDFPTRVCIRISQTIAENYAKCFNHVASFIGCVLGVMAVRCPPLPAVDRYYPQHLLKTEIFFFHSRCTFCFRIWTGTETRATQNVAVRSGGKTWAVAKRFNVLSINLQRRFIKVKRWTKIMGKLCIYTRTKIKRYETCCASSQNVSCSESSAVASKSFWLSRKKSNQTISQSRTAGKKKAGCVTSWVRTPEGASVKRFPDLYQEVARFYKNVQESMAKHKFPPKHTDNVDKTAISTVQEAGIILAPKHQKKSTLSLLGKRARLYQVCSVQVRASFTFDRKW